MHVNSSSDFFDIREYKNNLRKKFKQLRYDMGDDVKSVKDRIILEKLSSTQAYINCKRLLTYVSTDIEVDTKALINKALCSGKEVYVPKCIDGTRNMVFYRITSLKQLEPGTFSVLEPDTSLCQPIDDYSNSLCIVPALAYDMSGYRLGYGKGYYDRFLTAHNDIYKIGIGYCCCTLHKLTHGKFDIAVDSLVTEKYVKIIGREDFSFGK